MKSFLEFLKDFFKFLSAAPEVVAPVPVKPLIDYDYIAQALEEKFNKLVGIKEQNRNNRHPIIDEIVESEKGRKGESYCAYTMSYIINQVCADLDLKYPKTLYRGGSSQGFFYKSSGEYTKLTKPKKGLAFIQQTKDDPARGHVGYCTGPINSNGFWSTVEGNTDNMIKKRFDRSFSGTTTKKHLGFVDLAQAILDQYKEKNKTHA